MLNCHIRLHQYKLPVFSCCSVPIISVLCCSVPVISVNIESLFWVLSLGFPASRVLIMLAAEEYG